MAGNVLLGGLIGAAVDPSSGAMNDLLPNPVEVRLVPLSLGNMPSSDLPEEARLRRLRELRDNGAISAAEYKRERAKILREL